MGVRLGALKLYREHLVAQYSDRCAFWSLKDISGEAFSRVITIMTDGADQEATICLASFCDINMSSLIWFQMVQRCCFF